MFTHTVFAFCLLFFGFAAEQKVGARAKEFTVAALNGDTVALAGLRGKVVLINFWATWCVPCREELPRLTALQEKWRQRGLAVLPISIDNERDNITDFLERNGIKLQVFWDRDKRIAQSYDPPAMPSSYIIDRQGTLRFIHHGYSATELQRIEAEINQLLKQAAPADLTPKHKS